MDLSEPALHNAYAAGWNDFLFDQPSLEDELTGDERTAYLLGLNEAQDEYAD